MHRMTVEELPAWLKPHWVMIRNKLLEGTCQPQAVGQVAIPKVASPTLGWRMEAPWANKKNRISKSQLETSNRTRNTRINAAKICNYMPGILYGDALGRGMIDLLNK